MFMFCIALCVCTANKLGVLFVLLSRVRQSDHIYDYYIYNLLTLPDRIPVTFSLQFCDKWAYDE